jgi:IS4 transposase
MVFREGIHGTRASAGDNAHHDLFFGHTIPRIERNKPGGTGEIKRLYRKRWMIEKKYHALKNKMRFESVTGKAGMYAASKALCRRGMGWIFTVIYAFFSVMDFQKIQYDVLKE